MLNSIKDDTVVVPEVIADKENEENLPALSTPKSNKKLASFISGIGTSLAAAFVGA